MTEAALDTPMYKSKEQTPSSGSSSSASGFQAYNTPITTGSSRQSIKLVPPSTQTNFDEAEEYRFRRMSDTTRNGLYQIQSEQTIVDAQIHPVLRRDSSTVVMADEDLEAVRIDPFRAIEATSSLMGGFPSFVTDAGARAQRRRGISSPHTIEESDSSLNYQMYGSRLFFPSTSEVDAPALEESGGSGLHCPPTSNVALQADPFAKPWPSEGWTYVRSIPTTAIVELALREKSAPGSSARVIKICDGVNNHAAIVEYNTGDKVVVRIPACGSPGMWDSHGKATLMNVAHGMRYIAANTDVRMPKVLSIDTSFENPIRAPYLLMSLVTGTGLDYIWWDQEFIDNTRDCLTVPLGLEGKRQKMLRSMAEQVVKMRKMHFAHFGALRLKDGDISKPDMTMPDMLPFRDILERNLAGQADHEPRPGSDNINIPRTTTSSSSSKHYHYPLLTSSYTGNLENLHYWFENARQENTDHPMHAEHCQKLRGIFLMFKILIDHLPYGPGTVAQYPMPETFVLSHTDFSPQNIFADPETCEITGLIDWDIIDSKPRYVGWCHPPVWLCEDWDPTFMRSAMAGAERWPSRCLTSSNKAAKYRRDWARCLYEECARIREEKPEEELGDYLDDWRFATKSHLFEAIMASIGRTEDMFIVLSRILNEHVGLFDWNAELIALGRDGFQPGLHAWYTNLFRDLLDCDPQVIRAELGICDPSLELEDVVKVVEERDSAYAAMESTQKQLLRMYRSELADAQQQIERLQKMLNDREHPSQTADTSPASTCRTSTIDSQPSIINLTVPHAEPPVPGVTAPERDLYHEYLMHGALRPRSDAAAAPRPRTLQLLKIKRKAAPLMKFWNRVRALVVKKPA